MEDVRAHWPLQTVAPFCERPGALHSLGIHPHSSRPGAGPSTRPLRPSSPQRQPPGRPSVCHTCPVTQPHIRGKWASPVWKQLVVTLRKGTDLLPMGLWAYFPKEN